MLKFKSKYEVSLILKKIIKKFNFIKDIWIYGDIRDNISDLDLIILYKSEIKKVEIPEYVSKKILDGSIIYAPYRLRKDIFLFENLKCYSCRDDKEIVYHIDKKKEYYRSLTSFVERYYHRRLFIYEKFSRIEKIDNKLRLIKSLFISYATFFSFCNLEYKKKLKPLVKQYNLLRYRYDKTRKISKKEFIAFVKKLKKFDSRFFTMSKVYLDRKFDKIFINNFKFMFMNKYLFTYNFKNKKNNIPKLFAIIFYKYGSFKFLISKSISKDTIMEKKQLYIDPSFNYYLKKKINFINKCYIDLKKASFKKGMYRFSWYLN